MDSMSGTLNTLAQQAGLIGHEVSEHVEWVICSSSLIRVKIIGQNAWRSWGKRRADGFQAIEFNAKNEEICTRYGRQVWSCLDWWLRDADVRNRNEVGMVYNYSGSCTDRFAIGGHSCVRTAGWWYHPSHFSIFHHMNMLILSCSTNSHQLGYTQRRNKTK